MIPLNPDSDKWLVTFCFWTLTYRDIGLLYALYTVYTVAPVNNEPANY
jgi:hypothetical protein